MRLTQHKEEVIPPIAAIYLLGCDGRRIASVPSVQRQPSERLGTVVGSVGVAEAANDRIGLLNRDADGESPVAERK